MNIILLSGGSGKRLWPLSNDIRSKQFIKLFKRGESTLGEYESMLQRIFRQIKAAEPDASVTIAASKSQVSAIHNQLGEHVDISVEPCRRDTFAAIALATAYLHNVKGVQAEEAVVVCPVDFYVEEGYFDCVKAMYKEAAQGEKKLVLMGIEPTYPSEKYGYIKPARTDDGGYCYAFTEKPTKEEANKYISAGAFWNSGIFAYKLGYVLEKSRKLLGTSDHALLLSNYSFLKKISFDYAIVEQETSIAMIRYSGAWKDLGTWNTLTEAMEEEIVGEAILSDSCENVHVVNELGIPVLAVGCKNLVISASAEGILVSDKEQSSYIKLYVDSITQPVKFAEKSWGSYRVLDVQEESMVILVTLNPGSKMNYHAHYSRDEVWTAVKGNGTAIVDGLAQMVRIGTVIAMQAGCKHTVIAGEQGLQLIEVQMGKSISVSDKKKYEMPKIYANNQKGFN